MDTGPFIVGQPGVNENIVFRDSSIGRHYLMLVLSGPMLTQTSAEATHYINVYLENLDTSRPLCVLPLLDLFVWQALINRCLRALRRRSNHRQFDICQLCAKR